jgi:acetoacetyl-CoA synthetase
VENTPTTIDRLVPIWQRALQRSYIGVDDDFFALGGNPSIAANLFAEIAEVSGRELTPLMIYQAPTIGELAALLDQPGTPTFEPLVQLKAGTGDPPVFIAPGLDGNISELFELVRHIRSHRPIYGMQARGMDGVDAPFECIEDMARFYLDAIRKTQPRGPYLFIGYSLGGLITLEIAQRLSRSGEQIAMLALLDTYPGRGHLPMGQRVRLLYHRGKHRVSKLIQGLTGNSGDQSRTIVPLSPAARRVHDGSYIALQHYRPRYYSGRIRFVSQQCKVFSRVNPYAVLNPAAVWADLAGAFEVEIVPGDHHGMVLEHFESLASLLSRYLQEALP